MVGSRTENVLCTPEPPRPGSDAHAAQKSDIKFGVDPAVVVAAHRGDTTFSLEESEVLGCYPKLTSSLADVEYRTVHRRPA
jgi:hypothetical protein